MREAEADTVPVPLAAVTATSTLRAFEGGGGNIVMFPRPKNK
jgi:hypothetical protein